MYLCPFRSGFVSVYTTYIFYKEVQVNQETDRKRPGPVPVRSATQRPLSNSNVGVSRTTPPK